MQRIADMRTRAIKQTLLTRRRDLLARYHGELDRAAEELDSREPELVELATEQWDAGVLTKLSEVDAASLGKIISALRRVESGTYGTCLECGIAIQPARLHVLPEADACFECATDAERPLAMVRGG